MADRRYTMFKASCGLGVEILARVSIESNEAGNGLVLRLDFAMPDDQVFDLDLQAIKNTAASVSALPPSEEK